jgi:hypothetical protein
MLQGFQQNKVATRQTHRGKIGGLGNKEKIKKSTEGSKVTLVIKT